VADIEFVGIEDLSGKMDQLEEAIRLRVRLGIRAGTELLNDTHLTNITQVQEAGPPFEGPHSSPGEFPYVETGTASDALTSQFKSDNRGFVTGEVGYAEAINPISGGSPGEYMEKFLKGKGRLSLIDTFHSIEDQLVDAVAVAISKAS
jgi:hypothetical protein